MRILPGKNLLRVFGVLIGCALATFFLPGVQWLFPAVLLPVACLIVVDYRTMKKCFKQVSVQRDLPTTVGRGAQFPLELQISNGGSDSLLGEIRDVFPAESNPFFWSTKIELPPHQQVVLRQELQIAVRGSYEFGPLWLRLQGKFGMLDAQQLLNQSAMVKVLPEGYHSREVFSKSDADEIRMLDKIARARRYGVGTEFESLSEYRTGDDPRRIDWRATARQRRPIIRRFQIERHRDLMIILDCGRLMGTDAERGTKLDCAVDASLMLSRVALISGDRCGLGFFDDQILGYLPPISGSMAMRTLTECVYNLHSRWRESDFSLMFATLQRRQSKRSLVVILSDIVDVETSLRFRTSLSTLTRRHVVIFAALQTPLLQQTVEAPVESILDGSRKTVAFRILREREKAIHSIRRSGVHVLDVEPARLTVPLLNQFIDLRSRNLL